VVLGDDGQKLSKQAHAAPVTSEDSATVLATALKALGQRPVDRNPIGKMLDQAIRQWALDQIPRQLTIPNRDL
jgi:glutamyl-Q tRNA(Asp) synthetase